MHEVQAGGVRVVLVFLLNPLVSRANPRIPIRMVRFWDAPLCGEAGGPPRMSLPDENL